ncbi:hypothetical protein PYCCODRAFT_851098 [Trametes coccinea BRFM310]|uniref:DUF6534 domain-containing protein n=1 Tax=Trametes coccinea (strain BRFM310) TaxID=1353009 RepID=A0A1Y2IH79_TRAC3|nr:hypothetical protein PYCCODRAFT_851098 [Trametes coccinea BRFM310]
MEDYLTVVIATIVQFYFTRSLWIFSRRNRPLAAILVFLTLLGLGSGTWIAADLFMEPSVVTLYAVVKPRIVVAVCSGSTAVADVIISAGLCIFLQMSRTGIQRSNTLIDKLMKYAIQRGLLTATVQMIDFITIVAAPTSLAVLPAGLMLSKLYTNAFLASLNVRHSLREEISGTRISIELGPIPDLEFACESDTAVVQNSDPGCPSHAGPAPIHSTVSTAASGINCPRLTNEVQKFSRIIAVTVIQSSDHNPYVITDGDGHTLPTCMRSHLSLSFQHANHTDAI